MKKNLKLPVHIAVIMDGNGRWARMRNLDRIEGHKRGIEVLKKITESVYEKGIPYFTAYSFSKENWKRPREEVEALMMLLRDYLRREKNEFFKKNIRLKVIGDKEDIPEDIRTQIDEIEDFTKDRKDMTLIFALSYSGRSEIVKAIKKIFQDLSKGKLNLDEIDELTVFKYLDTSQIPDPDLLIRTGGEIRLSNFLLWQVAYTELYFTPVLWPDFTEEHLEDALKNFTKRERRFGMTSEQLGTISTGKNEKN